MAYFNYQTCLEKLSFSIKRKSNFCNAYFVHNPMGPLFSGVTKNIIRQRKYQFLFLFYNIKDLYDCQQNLGRKCHLANVTQIILILLYICNYGLSHTRTGMNHLGFRTQN
jgi:hypothetical protein